MFEILMFLFENYFDAGSYPDSDKLSLKLTAAGFDDEDIHLALTWLSVAGKVHGVVVQITTDNGPLPSCSGA